MVCVYSYNLVVCRNHHCRSSIFTNNSYVLTIFDSFKEFVKLFLKLFHSKNFHFVLYLVYYKGLEYTRVSSSSLERTTSRTFIN